MANAILIVDDSATSRMITQATLFSAGWPVALAVDGEQALATARAQPPILVVTDWTMPGMGGAGLLAALRADPILGAIPVLVHSTEQAESEQQRAQALGANAWLSKTAEPQTLLDAVARLLAQPEAAA